MKTLTFYEKPGCITNNKQKRLLQDAGIRLAVVDLLKEPWTALSLAHFLGGLPVPEWINPNAPQVKDGTVDPQQLSEQEALNLLTENPLLIRRPLIACDDKGGKFKMVGFNLPWIANKLDLKGDFSISEDIEACSQPS